MPPITPVIPEFITVHLGPPDSDAENVTVSFPDYIKNVASGEIYPTWPESALRANIYAQISFALNKIFVEFYRARGYDFDITGSTAIDQSYVYGRNVFENISEIVDDIFNSYIKREGAIEPLSARFCNGTTVTCDGLSQWGSFELANQGYVPYEILQYYYGDDIIIVSDVPITNIPESYPGTPLRLGTRSEAVRTIKVQLNRISLNYPAIPKIYPVNDLYDENTEKAILKFQQIFNLAQDGIVGRQTWYELSYLYVGITRLTELDSEGITLASQQNPTVSAISYDIRLIQYYLGILSFAYPQIPYIPITGIYDEATKNAIIQFQKLSGLPEDGVITEDVYYGIYDAYISVASLYDSFGENLPLKFQTVGNIRTVYTQNQVDENIRVAQNRLNVINNNPNYLAETGLFGPKTKTAVTQFQKNNGLYPSGDITPETWSYINRVYYDTAAPLIVLPNQYPGYILRIGMKDEVLRRNQQTLSEPIKNLQIMLRKIYNDLTGSPKPYADGNFDEDTRKVVMDIQSASALPASGEVNFETFERIRVLYDI